MLSWQATWRATHSFFTQAQQPYALATTRIFLGLASFANALFFAPDAETWFANTGVLPEKALVNLASQRHLSLFEWFGSSPELAKLVVTLYALAGLTLALGFFSRASAFLVYLCCVSLCTRNLYVMSAADNVLRLLPFFLAFSSCHATLSLDSWLHKRRHGTALLPAPCLGLRLVQLQICLLYIVTAICKAAGSMWRDGTAVYTVLQLTEFQRFPLPAFLQTPLMASLLTWATLAVEFLFPVCIWFRETRRPALIAAVGLHLALEYSMNIQMFQVAMLVGLTAFVKDDELHSFVRFCRKPRNLFRPPLTTAEEQKSQDSDYQNVS